MVVGAAVQEQKGAPSYSHISCFFSSLKNRLASTSIITYLLFCVFGVGSWVAINGVWAELPILLVTQPECFKLATVLALIFQAANIGPLLYLIVKVIWHKLRFRDFNLEVIAVFLIIGGGIASSLLLGMFRNHTAVIGGESSSIALYVLAFSLAFVDCTSSVLFIPFVKHYPAKYLTALYIGEGLSGVIPSVVALIQGSVDNSLKCVPGNETYTSASRLGIRFSPNLYFFLLAMILVLCCMAFIGLLIIPASRKERLAKEERHVTFLDKQQDGLFSETETRQTKFVEDQSPLLEEDDSKENAEDQSNTGDDTLNIVKAVYKSKAHIHFIRKLLMLLWEQRTPLCCLTVLSFFLNGALPSVSSFAFGGYGNLTLHLAVNLGLLAAPLAAFLYMIVPTRSNLLIAVFTALCCLLGIYIIINAFSYGSLIAGTAGRALIIIVNVAITALGTYSKVAIAVVLHSDKVSPDIALLLNGLCTQLGALIGAVLFFILVYFTTLFM